MPSKYTTALQRTISSVTEDRRRQKDVLIFKQTDLAILKDHTDAADMQDNDVGYPEGGWVEGVDEKDMYDEDKAMPSYQLRVCWCRLL